ncbi:hypothetical protein [Mangrovactinospora gilvigrisea]|uniref:hypothetical protein n=1 Tax=Mangrovactinospora gilvigrisea TaxID=1428644 RepID=UPI001587E5D5|nr:hypothetical protein [Mangrovactinospora gilvigrisea]
MTMDQDMAVEADEDDGAIRRECALGEDREGRVIAGWSGAASGLLPLPAGALGSL